MNASLRAPAGAPATASRGSSRSFHPLRFIGHHTREGITGLGQITTFVASTFTHAARPPFGVRAYLYQLLQVGIRSLPLSLTTALFAGMVLAFQFGYGLSRFGARLFIGQTTVTALVRELGPMLTALVVGSRIGAGMAAELAGMAVTEQLDAVRALGADPLQRLVAPRIAAAMIALPLLTILADVVGFGGGMIIAALQYDVSPTLYTQGVLGFVEINDFGSGILKITVFAFLIATISCREGMRARGGTEGVGRATTRAVVASALSVLISDFFLTKLMLST